MPVNPLLEVNHLRTSFFSFSGEVQAVRDVSLRVQRGEIVGVVGESGSGKSVTFLSVTRLLGESGKIVGGDVRFDGEDVLTMSHTQLRKMRNPVSYTHLDVYKRQEWYELFRAAGHTLP